MTAFDTAWVLLKDYDSTVFETLPEELHQFETQSFPQAMYEKTRRTQHPIVLSILDRFADKGYNELIMDKYRKGKTYFGHQFTPEQIDKIIEYDKKYEPYARNREKSENLMTFHSSGDDEYEGMTHRLGASQRPCSNAPNELHPPPLTPEGLEWSWERPKNDDFIDDDGKTYKVAPGTYSGPWHPITGRQRNADVGERWVDNTYTDRDGETYTTREKVRDPNSFGSNEHYYPRLTTEEHPHKEVCERCRISEDGRKEYCPDASKPYDSMMYDLRSFEGDIWDSDGYGILPFYGDRLARTSPLEGGPYGFMDQRENAKKYPELFPEMMLDRDFVARTQRKIPTVIDGGKPPHDVFCPKCRGYQFEGSEDIGVWNPSFAGNPKQWFGVLGENNKMGRVEMNIDPLTMRPLRGIGNRGSDVLAPPCVGCGNPKTRWATDSETGDSAIRNNQFMSLRHFDDLDAIANWKGVGDGRSIKDLTPAEMLERVHNLDKDAWDGIDFDDDLA